MSDEDYVANKRSDRVYVSRPFKIGATKDTDARYVTRVFDDGQRSCFDSVDDEIVIRATHDDKVQIKAVVTSDQQGLRHLTLQSFRIYKDGTRPNEQYGINLRGQEIAEFVEFAQLASNVQLDNTGKLRLDRASLAHVDVDMDSAARAWIAKHPDALREFVASEATSRDVVAVAYRRKQLAKFAQLLSNDTYFDQVTAEHFNGRKEATWQGFFERNRWIFGYGLFHLSADGFTDEKLEQVVAGSTVATPGKRIDGLLRTRGRISAACLVEIKHHRTPLLAKGSYRAGTWQPSQEVTGAVSQILMSVDGMERQFQRLLVMRDGDGNPTGEEAVVARPRSVIVCGSLSEFVKDFGINEDQFRSFELYRRHLFSPDIVTFDELYERAKLIVESSD
ncbi:MULTISPECIES: Shedu immune nuclease family protein [Stenotrophomonas maltophilia group]|uniref:Shedu immune nuclease family protein n=1 Tax=Stenotrophomonas maltophilia TaxID=40324 RepID=A0AAJ2JBH7_STEMA|nr:MULTISPECIES: Shedu immune nuclease family protein [Stenotrophomonas maltophilia group]MDT3467315.1 Shedu immune nuclease family protein [Stenotrophomonas maltophilia]